ncbi:U3 small nucleolar RNA-associated protein 14 homolog A-like isoform X2 [Watersipora subatra]|uniref:U3 small nucleolar RNA-associated protein 14 homolog A-like isoform X2 n=1 Tax=Watersipora subatra TaxID=2589382 RepID=UPI00355B7FDF
MKLQKKSSSSVKTKKSPTVRKKLSSSAQKVKQHSSKGKIPKKQKDDKANSKNKAKGILKTKEAKKKPVKSAKKEDDTDETDGTSAQHSSLLKSIQSLDGKKVPISQRSETAPQSEYHSKGSKRVQFGELLKSLDTADTKLKNHLSRQDGSRKLPQPLEKIHVKKAERAVKYAETKNQLQKWENIVEENRVVPQQQFPLERSHISIPSAKKEAAIHRPRTEMELEIQALLRGEEYVPEEKKEVKPILTWAEQRAERSMNLAKAREELALRRRHRKMVADLAAKNRRQGKIKSRKKNAFKALEKLKSEDPQLWKEKAEEVERARIEERATLRHKGKSKFAKVAKRYGKFNEKIKDSLDEMRSKGVELMKKQVESDSSSGEESEEERADVDMNDSESEDELEPVPQLSSNNPWASQKLRKETAKAPPLLNTAAFDGDSSEEEEDDENKDADVPVDFTQSDEVVVIEPDMSSDNRGIEEAMDAANELSQDADDLLEGQTARRLKTRSDVDKFDAEFEGAGEGVERSSPSSDEEGQEPNDIDVNKVISIPSTDLTGHTRTAPGDSDDDEEHGQSLAQAFADDNIAEEFAANRKRKFDQEDEAADAEAALAKLPGWGRWSGAGIENQPQRKMSRFQKERLRKENLRKAAEKAERDVQRSRYPRGVIVNEEAIRSQPIAKFQVSRMKTSLKTPTFQALMSHPVGKDFVPAVAHNELCKPKIVTGVGSIISPMDKDMVQEKTNSKFPSDTVSDGKKIAQPYVFVPMPRSRMKPSKQLKNRVKS